MRGLRFSMGLLLAAIWIAPLHAQQPTGTVRGHVTDSTTQQPIRGATVFLLGRSSQTRADGVVRADRRAAGHRHAADLDDRIRAGPSGGDGRGGPGAGSGIPHGAPGGGARRDGGGRATAKQRQGNVTGAVTNVTAEEFNTGRVVTPTELIQNKVAGVQVVENTEPGGRTSIRIRGATSMNASNEPLYVVDGLPMGDAAACPPPAAIRSTSSTRTTSPA